MANVSLKINAEFAQAFAEFKKLESTSEAARLQIKKFQKGFDPASIDKFIAKNKLASIAISGTKGPLAGAKAEVAGLTKEMIKLQSKGLDPTSKDFQKLSTQLVDSRSKVDKLTASAKKNSKSFSSMNKVGVSMIGMLKNLAIGFSVMSLFRIANFAIDSWHEQEVAIANVQAGLDSTNNAIGVTSMQFQKMAAESQKVGIFGDEKILQNLTAQFLTFGNIGASNFDRIQKSAMDVTAKLKGVNATGEDLKATAIMMGKAMDDPIRGMSAMRRVGISFSDSEVESVKIMMKHNDVIGAQNLMLQAIERQYGGTNAALAKTDAGMEKAAKNKFGDAMELLGKRLIPVKVGLLEAGSAVADLMSVMLESDTDQFQRDMVDIIKLQEELIARRGEGFVDDGKDYYADQISYIEKMVGVSVPLNATAKERLDIYKNITKVSEAEALAMGLLASKGREFSSYMQKTMAPLMTMVDEFNKNNPAMKKGKDGGGGGGTGAKKTEEQLMQERLNTMAMSQQAYEQQRLNTMQSFYDQRVALQGVMNEQEMASYVANETQKIASSRMTDDQKLAAMKALDVAVQKQHKANSINYTAFTQQMLGTTGGMLTDLQTVFKNAGKESKALAVTMKIVSAAQAAIASYLAFTETLAAPMLVAAFPANIIGAGVVLAAGLAKQAAILSTPISGQTGLSNYTVPDVASNRNDKAPVMAQGGETVNITPRGEDDSKTTEINISIAEQVIFSTVTKGIKNGQINVNANNIGRGVFAN